MVYLDDFDESIMEFMSDFGGTAIVTIYTEGVYNPSTGDVAVTTKDYPVQAILLDMQLRSNGLQDISQTLIEAGDKRCYIRPPEKYSNVKMPIPHPNKDKITMGGLTYKIVSFKQVNPGMDNAILYELVLRQ